jgi:rubrerythrin
VKDKSVGSVLTVRHVLERAIDKEIGSQRLYKELGQKAQDDAAKYAFAELVTQEEGHQQLLERYLSGELGEGALTAGQAVDYKIAEHLDQPEISPDMKLDQVFLLAARREVAAHDFYLGLSGIHPEGEVKKLIEGLAAQEMAHKQRVESLYTDVAFPQLDGG